MNARDLTETEIQRMRYLRSQGIKCYQIADRFGVSESTVSRCTKDCRMPEKKGKKKRLLTLVHTDGTKAKTTNLQAFARDHNLTYNSLWLVVKGNRNYHKGWYLDAVE